MPVSSSLSRWSRPAGLLLAPMLTLGALVAAPAASSGVEPTPEARAADYIAGQLVDGKVPDTYFDATVDAGLALLAAGGHAADVAAVIDLLAGQIDVYVVGEGLLSEQFNPGEAAHTALLVRAAGGDVTDFGGRDLLDDVESHVDAQGRVVGTYNYRNSSDNVVQSYGVRALAAAESPKSELATDFLLGLQCPGGSWVTGSGGGSDGQYQTCPEVPSGVTEVTALAVLALASQADEPAVRAAVDDGVAWLLDVQAADGSFPRADTAAGNADAKPDVLSTGRAGEALRSVGQVEAADAADGWLLEQQDAQGAIANAGATDLNSYRTRATSAALLGLLAARPPTVPRVIQPDAGFVRAHSLQDVTVEGLAPGQEVRVSAPWQTRVVAADAAGRAVAPMRLPRASGRRDITVSVDGSLVGTVSFDALAATDLGVTTRYAVLRATRTQRVVVEGLSAGEDVRVRYRGAFVAYGTARADGRFEATFHVGRNAGQRRVRVLGEFRNRDGAQRFVVTQR